MRSHPGCLTNQCDSGLLTGRVPQAIVGERPRVQDYVNEVFSPALADYHRLELLWLACTYQEQGAQVRAHGPAAWKAGRASAEGASSSKRRPGRAATPPCCSVMQLTAAPAKAPGSQATQALTHRQLCGDHGLRAGAHGRAQHPGPASLHGRLRRGQRALPGAVPRRGLPQDAGGLLLPPQRGLRGQAGRHRQ